MENNLTKYADTRTVKYYARYSHVLQPPENAIRELLRDELSGIKMLDVGVGAGRTTSFFAPLVKEYTAIDYSPGMIDACMNKFSTEFSNARFICADARDLSALPAQHYNFILFSFNGIDNVACGERQMVLTQLVRCCVPGGKIAFSSHNLSYLPNLFEIHFRLHPVKFLQTLFGRRKFNKRNAGALSKMKTSGCVEIFDDVYDLGLNTCYVSPRWQVNELKKSGLRNIRLFDFSGQQLSESHYSRCKDPWIYYLGEC